MKLRKAITTTLEDWLHRDRAEARRHWLAITLLTAPIVPIIVLARWDFKEPERNPNFGKRPAP
jgi:hypothetical protein